jgi:hypothetical protein
VSGSAGTRQRYDWLAQSKMGCGAGPMQEGETRRERKAGWMREIGPKELREYRKEFLISRI